MWTWDKILKCEDIRRGVLVESKFYEIFDGIVLGKFNNDKISVDDGCHIRHILIQGFNYSDFKFFHTTGEEILPPKERETITLYETIENNCNSVYCDKDGNKYDLVEKEIKFSFDYFKKQRKANINKNKSVVIYADTFEVKEWN